MPDYFNADMKPITMAGVYDAPTALTGYRTYDVTRQIHSPEYE